MIFRLFVQKNNEWQQLDLPADFNLSLVQNSGFVGAKQSGSFSFSSSLPPTPNNCRILQNAENPQMVVDRKIQLPAKLLYGSSEYYSWYFILREAQNSVYKYELSQTPGNQPRNFYEKKLWQLDFGKLDLPSVPTNTGLWSINLYNNLQLFKYFISPPENPIEIIFGSNFRLPNPVYFEVWINNVMIAKTPTGGTSDAVDYWFNEKDPESRFAIVVKNIINYNIVLSVPKKGTGTINVVAKPSQLINQVSIKIFDHYLSNHIEKGAFIIEHQLINLSFDDVTASINAINQAQQPFKFLTYFNDSYYPSDNIQYEGIVNQYSSDTSLKLNTLADENSLNTYPISPCFSLKFILEKVSELMGFTLIADVFQDKIKAGERYLGDLYLVNNVDLAAQMPGTTIAANTYGKSIIYANFMQDMTIKEFIDAIRSLCLSVEYDYNDKIMTVSPCKSVFESTEVIDISNKLTRFPVADILDKTYYQLSFKGGDNSIISQLDYPTEESIADDGKDYTKIEIGFTPVLNNFDLDQFLITDKNPYIPTVNDTARSVLYIDQKTNRPSQKISFYLGMGHNGLSYVSKSNNNNGVICLSFENQGTLKGLRAVFFQEYLDFLNQTTLWSADINLSELALANFKFAQKYYAYGTTFIVESIAPKLPVKDVSKIKLLSL